MADTGLLAGVIVTSVVAVLALVVVGLQHVVLVHATRESPGGVRGAWLEALGLKEEEDNRPMKPVRSRPSKVAPFQTTGGERRMSTKREVVPTVVGDEKYAWEIDPKAVKRNYMLDRGSYGEVWLGTWMGTPVAVKTLLPKIARKQEMVDRFVQEILMMSALYHVNVVQFMGASIRPPEICLVTEYCPYGSLSEFLQSERQHKIKITMNLILRFALDIARGIFYLHARTGIVQRDIKPQNILIDASLNAKVADFGLSRVMDGKEHRLTACGTPAYTAPEIVRRDSYTEKVDVYSFGILLWEILMRKPPYEGDASVAVAYAAAEGRRPEIPSFCPEEYARLMRECWADSPDDRPTFKVILKRLFNLKKQMDGFETRDGASAGISLVATSEGVSATPTTLRPPPAPVDDDGDGDGEEDGVGVTETGKETGKEGGEEGGEGAGTAKVSPAGMVGASGVPLDGALRDDGSDSDKPASPAGDVEEGRKEDGGGGKRRQRRGNVGAGRPRGDALEAPAARSRKGPRPKFDLSGARAAAGLASPPASGMMGGTVSLATAEDASPSAGGAGALLPVGMAPGSNIFGIGGDMGGAEAPRIIPSATFPRGPGGEEWDGSVGSGEFGTGNGPVIAVRSAPPPATTP